LGSGVDVDAQQLAQHDSRDLRGEIEQGCVARRSCSDSELLEPEHEMA
jgi:hypothetical protein